MANKEFDLLQLELVALKEIESAEKNSSGFFKLSYFSRNTDSDEKKKEKIEKLKQNLMKINEEKLKLTNEVESLIANTVLASEFPADVERFKFSFVIQQFSLQISEGSNDLLKYVVHSPNFFISLAPSYFLVKAGIKSSEIVDSQDSLVFPYILRSTNYDLSVTNLKGLAISMNSGDLEIVMKVKSIMKTVEALKEPFVNDFDYTAYTAAATDKTKAYISEGEKYFSEVLTTGIKSSIKLDIHLKAPVFIVPLNTANLKQGMLIIDFGLIDITTSSLEI